MMNTIRPGSFGMVDGRVGALTPEEQKALEAKNKKFVKISLIYWLCAFLVLVLAFVIMVILAPATEGDPSSYLGMIIVLFLWIVVAGTGNSVIYWAMLRRKKKPTPNAEKQDKEPWE